MGNRAPRRFVSEPGQICSRIELGRRYWLIDPSGEDGNRTRRDDWGERYHFVVLLVSSFARQRLAILGDFEERREACIICSISACICI